MTNATDTNPDTGKAYAINPSSGIWDDNYFDSKYGNANRAEQKDMAQYDTLGNQVANATSNFATGLNANENNAFNDYLHTVQAQPSSVDTYNQQLDKAGVPALQKTSATLQGQIYNLQDTLRRVEPNVSATTSNSLVTEAQRQGMVTAQQKPLNDQLGWLGQSEGRITDAITQGKADALQLTNLNSADQAKLLDAYKTKLSLAQSQGTRALQAFTTDISNTLNVSLAKISRGEKLSDTEAANAFQLLQMKQQAALDIQKANSAPTQNDPSKRYVSLGNGTELYDTQTGKIVADNPKSSGAAAANPWG